MKILSVAVRMVIMLLRMVVKMVMAVVNLAVMEYFQIYSGGHHDLYRCKPSISISNVALNANPGTVLKSACPEDSKTLPTCSNWLSFDWDIWDQRQMIWF